MQFILAWNNFEYWLLFPAVPNDALTISRGQNNQVFEGLEGQMQSLGRLELASFEMQSFFPARFYSWAPMLTHTDPWQYVRRIEEVRARRIPFRAICLGEEGKEVFNLPVSVESFEYREDPGGDVAFRLSFREYRFAVTPLTATLPAQEAPKDAADTEAPAPVTRVVTASQAAAAEGTSPSGPFTRLYTQAEANKLAKLIMGEAGGLSKVEIACVAWCVCNQKDAGFAKTLDGVMVPNHFNGLRTNKAPNETCTFLATDVLDRWSREHAGQTNVGRVLPKGYVYFMGDGKHNYFCQNYHNGSITYCKNHAWDYSLPNPYA